VSAASRTYAVRFAQLGALWASSVSQPVFSLLDGNPEFLVVRGATRTEVVVFAVLLAVGPPAVAVAVEWLAGLVSPKAPHSLHLVFVGLFVLPLALLVVQLLDASAAVSIVAALALSALVVACFVRWRPVRLFVGISIVLPLFGLLSFVLGTPLVTEDVSGANVQVGKPTPVVMVVFDELPVSSLMKADGSLDSVRYPNFGRLARSATWYPRATTVHDHTTGAVPAILTGALPRVGALPRLSDHPVNLFTLLGESYEMRVHEEVTYLCPKRYCPRPQAPFLDRLTGLYGDVRVAFLRSILPDSLAEGLPELTDRWSGFENTDRLLAATDQGDVNLIVANRAHVVKGIADEFVRGIRPHEPTATLNFVHFALPHAPWHYLPSGQQYDGTDLVPGVTGSEAWVDDPWLVEQRYQRHLLQVGYTDHVLGRILDRLVKTGLYDRSLVVVLADHGVSFRAGVSRRPVVDENLADIARVPLFVKLPGQRDGAIDERSVRTVDVLPTIADVLDLPLPAKVDGQSLLLPGVSSGAVQVLSRTGELVHGTVAELDREQARTLRNRAALFGEGADSLYRIGRHVELLGRSTRDLDVHPAASSIELDAESLLADVRTSSPVLPARITGAVDGVELGVENELAVAVNGRIVALTRPFRAAGRLRFEAIVPETALRNGYNRVELLSVTGSGTTTRLTALGHNER